ncbi:MAG: exodeoxyribonuclease VII small subunit [Gemmataceae bacterium]
MSAKPTEIRFEDALRELDAILRDLEEGAVSLEDSLARYERGVNLLKQCYGQLQDAEHRVKMLTGTKEDGSPELQPFPVAADTRRPAKPSRD